MSASHGLERLWSPWRMAYIAKASGQTARTAAKRPPASGSTPASKAKERKECLFCRVAADSADREHLVLRRTPHALLMLNRYPYNPAHLMVAVRPHMARFAELGPGERADLLELTALAERALEAEYQPHGINAGVNLGRVAGAGFPGHLHLHLVPRWDGDTNFMPVIGRTRVLPESLLQTWTRMRRALAALEPKPRTAARRG